MSLIDHIRGSAFQYLGQVTNLHPGQSLVGSVGRSEVRKKCGTLVEELVFAWIDDGSIDPTQPPSFTLIGATDTSTWPTGDLCFDIRFTQNSQAVHSSTGMISVTNGITQP